MSNELRHNYGHTGDEILDDVLRPDEQPLADVIPIGNGYNGGEFTEVNPQVFAEDNDTNERYIIPRTRRGKALVAAALAGIMLFGVPAAQTAGNGVEHVFSQFDK